MNICENTNFNEDIIIAVVIAADLIEDTRHLCTHSRIDGIKAMSRGISVGKQVVKFANNYE